MRLNKKTRNRLWYVYVATLVIYYVLVMEVARFTTTGFLIAFAGIAVITLGFVAFIRRASRPPAPIGTPAADEPAPPSMNGSHAGQP